MTDVASNVPAGWYDDGSGRQRWWDGQAWGPFAPQPVQQPVQVVYAGREANSMPVNYTRQQHGHSIVLHLIFGIFVLWIPMIYITVSPNHYWHA
jgi:hypothetical protein